MGEPRATPEALPIREISRSDWERRQSDAHQIGDSRSRLWRERDGRFLKIFPRREDRLERVRSQARAFIDNTRRLAALGFRVPQVDECVEVAESFLFVVYPPLRGETLRDRVEQSGAEALEGLAKLYDRLHCAGIYFRAAHLGNLISEPGEDLGLIDVSDVKYRGRSLGPELRARNLAHLLGHRLDGATLAALGSWRQHFLDEYLDCAGFGPLRSRRLRWRLDWKLGANLRLGSRPD